jgi:DNA polymerase-3 subunit delta
MRKLFHGKDSFLSLRNAKSHIAQFNTDNSFEVLVIEAPEKDPKDFINLFSTQSMFNPNRIILFKRLYDAKYKEDIVEYLIKNPQIENSNNTHLLFWEDQKVPSNTKYFKLFKQNAFESTPLNKIQFYTLASEILNQFEISHDRNTVALLSSRVNYSPERLENEIKKINIQNIKSLSTEIILENSTDTLENDIWDLTKSINQNDKNEIFKILETLFAQQTDPTFIISMIARNLRQIVSVKKLLEQNLSTKEICSKLRIPPFTLPELQSSARNSDWEKLSFLYEKLASLDFEIKIGNIEPNTGLLLLLNKI